MQVTFCVIRPSKLHLKAQMMKMNECILMNVWEFEIILCRSGFSFLLICLCQMPTQNRCTGVTNAF